MQLKKIGPVKKEGREKASYHARLAEAQGSEKDLASIIRIVNQDGRRGQRIQFLAAADKRGSTTCRQKMDYDNAIEKRSKPAEKVVPESGATARGPISPQLSNRGKDGSPQGGRLQNKKRALDGANRVNEAR